MYQLYPHPFECPHGVFLKDVQIGTRQVQYHSPVFLLQGVRYRVIPLSFSASRGTISRQFSLNQTTNPPTITNLTRLYKPNKYFKRSLGYDSLGTPQLAFPDCLSSRYYPLKDIQIGTRQVQCIKEVFLLQGVSFQGTFQVSRGTIFQTA